MRQKSRIKGLLLIVLACLLVGCFSIESEAAVKIKWKNTANTRTVLVNSSTTLKTNYKNSKVRWSSSNKKIATVNSKGKVKFKKTGTVTIKCRTKKSSKMYVKCKFYVKKKASGFKVSPGKSTLYVGESCSSNFSISPSNAYSIRTWGSSNTSVATVDGNGKVTARNPGKATITATLKDGTNRKSSYTVNVVNNIIQSEEGTKFIAHRGFSSQAPENTIKAFELAGDAGFWGAECDVQVTSDGEFVIYHNDKLDTCDDEDVYVKNVSLDYIKSKTINFEKVYNFKTYGKNFLKHKGEKSAYTIPTLDEYLDVCLKKNMVPVIEIKMAYNEMEEDQNNNDQEENTNESGSGIGNDEIETQSLNDGSEETELKEAESEETEPEEAVSEEEKVALELEEEIQALPEVYELHGQVLQSVNRTTLERLYDQVKGKMGSNPYVFIAFDERSIVKMESLYEIDKEKGSAPNMSVQWLIKSNEYDTNKLSTCIKKNRGLDIAYGALSSKYFRNVQKQGVEINVWTIDDLAKTRELYNAGVDYITTNVKHWR